MKKIKNQMQNQNQIPNLQNQKNSHAKTILRGIAGVLLVVLSISFLSFALIELAPGDPADIMLRASGVLPSPEAVEALRQDMGLDQPFLTRYFAWLGGILHGDFGTAYSTGRPVLQTLLPAMGRTVTLTAVAFGLTVLLSLPLGLLCARRRDSWLDRLLRFFTYVCGATPNFVLGLGLLYGLAVKLKWLPAIGNGSARGYILPVTVLTLGTAAWMIRQVRTAALETRGAGYLTALRARGIRPARMERYVLKSALLPIIASLGTCLGSMLAGAVVIENIFSLSGLGRLVLSAIQARDFPLLQGFILWIAVIYYLINFSCDRLNRVFDPRLERRRLG